MKSIGAFEQEKGTALAVPHGVNAYGIVPRTSPAGTPSTGVKNHE